MTFQEHVSRWVVKCHGSALASNPAERDRRFIEEALELIQARENLDVEDVMKLVQYVFGRDQGEVFQEVGGVMVTLAALCAEAELSMQDAGEVEIMRCWEMFDRIREKQKMKRLHGVGA